jgi:hypothetical protein
MSVVRPTFRDLDTAEAHQILARNHVGRIAYSFHDRVDIEPISYVYADGVIYLRTTVGSKLTTLARAPWVAFDVDEVVGPFDLAERSGSRDGLCARRRRARDHARVVPPCRTAPPHAEPARAR